MRRRTKEARERAKRLGPSIALGLSVLSLPFPDLARAQSGRQAVELRVVGQPTLDAQLTTENNGRSRITGRLRDELGQPLPGVLLVQSSNGESLDARPCEASGASSNGHEPKPSGGAQRTVAITSTGEFCVRLSKAYQTVKLHASSPHFVDVRSVLENDGTLNLRRPRFTHVPQTLDLGEPVPFVAEVLAGTGPGPGVAGAALTLAISCNGIRTQIDSTSLSGSNLARFEFQVPPETNPGNCLLLAEAHAPGHAPQIETRNVLVRSLVEMTVASVDTGEDIAVTVVVQTTFGHPISEGIVEATLAGAHVVSAPVKEGRARLVLEAPVVAQQIELRYVPAGPAFLPPAPIGLRIEARQVGFRWATLHSLGLIAFCAWIAYAWLHPRRRGAPPVGPPPRKPLVEATKESTGPIAGRVVDAHTGEPLPGVQLSLCQQGATDRVELESTLSNLAGEFRFETKRGNRAHISLLAKNETHMSLRAPVHGAELTVHLSEMRREAVRSLIEWTKRVGPPWTKRPAPTPADVKVTAQVLGRPRELHWAEQVERLAYQREAPTEGEVAALSAPEKLESAP